MTEAIYIEINHKVDELNGKRYVSVSGMLRHLGVSRSGYNAWLVRQPSNQEQRKLFIVDKIQDMYCSFFLLTNIRRSRLFWVLLMKSLRAAEKLS